MATPTNKMWSTTANATIKDCNSVVSCGAIDGRYVSTIADTFNTFNNNAELCIKDSDTGESYVLIDELRDTKMLLSIITDVLDNIIKDNPDIVQAKSIKELVDQQKMMNKLSK